MPTAVEFMLEYRNLQVPVSVEESASTQTSRQQTVRVELKKYFMMNWAAGSGQLGHFNDVNRQVARTGAQAQRSRADNLNLWYRTNRESIMTAAMGKGRPQDYVLALQWAVLSGHIPDPTQLSVQAYFDQNLGIDCSGFATNYLINEGRLPFSHQTLRNTSAQSYYRIDKAVNDFTAVREGDLLVLMNGNQPKGSPGHVMVVDRYTPMSSAAGNMQVVEASPAGTGMYKLQESTYSVERIFERNSSGNQVMILQVKRFGASVRVAVMRY